jgi:hypothetical protein
MIEFKTPRIEMEFFSGQLKKKLVSILYMLKVYCEIEFNKNIFITELFRMVKEQYNYYKDDPKFIKDPFTSVHQDWRGADLRSTVFTLKEIKKIVAFLNLITYRKGSKYLTVKYHKISSNVYHLHIQVTG